MSQLNYLSYKTAASNKSYTFKELYHLYKVDPRTFKKWLKNKGIHLHPRARFFSSDEIEKIATSLILPYSINAFEDRRNDYKNEITELNKAFEVRPYKLIELCKLYKVHPKTFKKWLLPVRNHLGKMNGRYFIIPQVQIIIEEIGLPAKFLPSVFIKEKPFTSKSFMELFKLNNYKNWNTFLKSCQLFIEKERGYYYKLKQVIQFLKFLNPTLTFN